MIFTRIYMKNIAFYCCFLMFLTSGFAQNQPIQLTISNGNTIIDRDTLQTILINNQFTGPTLRLTQNTAHKINITNKLKEPTSIHFVGLELSPRDIGDVGINSVAIAPGATKTIQIKTDKAGSFIYYGTTKDHKQLGLYGAIVVESSTYPNFSFEEECVILLSDFNKDAHQEVIKTLKRNSRWYDIKKKKTQTAFDYLYNEVTLDRIKNAFKRIPAIGLSEIKTDYQFINGDTSMQISGCKQGNKILLRLINASSATNYDVKFAASDMLLTAVDGIAVDTQSVDRILIGMGETYDVLIEIPSDSLAYEFRAQAQDGYNYTSIFFGDSAQIHGDSSLIEPHNISVQNIFKSSSLKGVAWNDELEVYKNADTTGMNKLQQMAAVRDQYKKKNENVNADSILREQDLVLNYHMIKALDSSHIDTTKPSREVKIKLHGNMQRYTFDVSSNQTDRNGRIKIAKGENVKLIIKNKTPLYQPLHLSGHYFRTTNAQGKYSPYKHTINIKPLDEVTLDVLADKDKDYNLYTNQMFRKQTGLQNQVHYEGYTQDSDVAKAASQQESDRVNFGHIGLMYNMVDFFWTSATHKTDFKVDFESDYRFYFETDIDYSYYVDKDQFLSLYAGAFINGGDNRVYVIDSNDVTASFKASPKAVVGMRYTLPLFINAEARINHDLDWRVEFSGKIPLMPYVNIFYRANTDKEWQVMLEGRIIKRASVMLNIDHLYGFGLGGTWKF